MFTAISKNLNNLPRDITVICFVITFIFSAVIIQNHSSVRNQNISRSAASAVKTIDIAFDEAEYLLKFMAKSIRDDRSPRNIELTLTNYKADQRTSALADWNYVSWITPQRNITINSRAGILILPAAINKSRPALELAFKTPGRLFIGKPDLGIVSGQRIIPTSMGVADNAGKIIGVLHWTFMAKSMESKLQEAINNDLKFIIVDKVTKDVLIATDKIAQSSFQGDELKAGGFTYRIIQQSDKSPFAIAIGYDSALDLTTLGEKLLLGITLLAGIGLLCFKGFRLFYQKAIYPLFIAVEDILVGRKVIHSVDHLPEVQALAQKLADIIAARDTTEIAYKAAAEARDAAQKSIAAISEMYTAKEVLSFSNQDDEAREIDVEDLLSRCLDVYAHQAYENGIATNLQVQSNKVFTSDPFKLKQIIISFIAYSFKCDHDNDSIGITAKNTQLFGKNYLAVIIENNGMHINSELGIGNIDIEGVIQSNNQNKQSGLLNALRLLKHLDGHLHIDSVIGSATKYTVFVPESVTRSNIISIKRNMP